MGITVLYDQDLSQLNLPDGVVFDNLTPQVGQFKPSSIASLCFNGTAPWGPFDVQQSIGSPQDQIAKIGPAQIGNNDLGTIVNLALLAGLSDIRTVRIGSGTQTAAVLPLLGLSAAFMNLTGRYMGSLVNAATAIYTYAPQTPAAQQSTSGNAGKVYVDLTIYPWSGAPQEIFRNLDGNLAVAALATPAAPTLTPSNTGGTLASGTTYNYRIVARNGAGTTMAGPEAGANATTTGSTGSILISWTAVPGAASYDVYGRVAGAELLLTNVAGTTYTDTGALTPAGALPASNTSASFKIDQTALANAAVAAVNTGQANGRGPSAFFVASVAAGVGTAGLPIVGTANVVTTPGTDGLDFGGSNKTLEAAMLGSNQTVPFTGMYAHAGNASGSLLCLIGETLLSTVAANALAFAKAQNAHYVGAFANGSASVTGASSNLEVKKSLHLEDENWTPWAGDWAEIVDGYNGAIHRFVDPSAMAAIRMAMTPPPNSPANLTIPLVVGTYRYPSTGIGINPYTDGTGGERNQLESGGVNFLFPNAAGDAGFTIAHNKNARGKAAQPQAYGNIAFARNRNYALLTFTTGPLGLAVGKAQGFNAKDDTVRRNLRALFNQQLSDWMRDGVFDAGCWVKCDLTNNQPGRGMTRVDIGLAQKEIIDIVAVGVVSGVGTFASINPGQTTPTIT